MMVLACEKKPVDSVIKDNQWDIINVEGSNSGRTGDTVQLVIYYPTSSGCDILDSLENTMNGNTYLVRAFGHTVNAICNMDATIRSAKYNFNTETKGTYLFRFQRKDGSFLLHTLKID